MCGICRNDFPVEFLDEEDDWEMDMPYVPGDYDEGIEEEVRLMKDGPKVYSAERGDLSEEESLPDQQDADSEFEVNEKGGRQSKLDVRYDLIPPTAERKVAEVLAEGAAKYGERNWRRIDVMSHLNHALAHIGAFRDAHINEDHEIDIDVLEELSHAATRLLMALEIYLVGEDDE